MSDVSHMEAMNAVSDLRRDVDYKFSELPNLYASRESVAKLRGAMSGKVSFAWFIGILFTILSIQAAFGYFVWGKIDSIAETTTITREAIANIQGRLDIDSTK